MNLNPNKFKGETVNPMVTRFSHEDCPQKGKSCFHVGMGAPFEECEFFKSEEDKPFAECTFEERSKEP